MRKALFVVIGLLLASIFTVSCGGAPNEKTPSVEEQLMRISGQVGFVFIDAQLKKVVKPEERESAAFFDSSVVNQFTGHGFFVNPSTVVFTRHQQEFYSEAKEWKVVKAQHYLSVPVRWKLYELEWLQTHRQQDLAFFRAKQTWDGLPPGLSVGRSPLPIQELSLYPGKLNEGDLAYILTTTGGISRIKTGTFRNATQQPLSVHGGYDNMAVEFQQSIGGPGESGSPVFVEKDGRVYLVGVVGYGTYDEERRQFLRYARITPLDLRQTPQEVMTAEKLAELIKYIQEEKRLTHPLEGQEVHVQDTAWGFWNFGATAKTWDKELFSVGIWFGFPESLGRIPVTVPDQAAEHNKIYAAFTIEATGITEKQNSKLSAKFREERFQTVEVSGILRAKEPLKLSSGEKIHQLVIEDVSYLKIGNLVIVGKEQKAH